MQKVSNEYKASMKSSLRERSYMMISFGLVNQEAQANATVMGNNFAYYSKQTGLFGQRKEDTVYATLEHDFTKVDGSMYFLPRENTSGNYYDTGLISKPLIPKSGYELLIELNVVATDIKGLTIRMENGSLTVIAGVLIAVGNSVFKTEKTTLTASNLDGTATKFEVGKDYCIYICDPTGGDATNFAAEQYRISLNTTYPNGYTAVTSRKIGGFHYGVVRKTNSSGIPISASGAALGSGWETNVAEGIVPNSVWTLLHRPTCDPTGMVFIGPFWGDIYLSSDNGASGLQSKKGVVPITGTEGLNWYIANERAMRVGKRLPTYAEFCKGAYGSPQGEDGNNTYAWSATSNTARTACGNVKNAVSATNVRDLVGNVWKWLDEFIHDPTGSAWNWYDVMSGQKVGQLYMANNTGLHALIGGGNWNYGVHDGSRTVGCNSCPWNVSTGVGVWCVCDSL